MLQSPDLPEEKRAALLSRLEDYTLNPQRQEAPTDAAAIEKTLTEQEPLRPVKLPSTASEIEGGKVQRTPEEEIEHGKMLAQRHEESQRILAEMNGPSEYTPPTAGILQKLSPITWQEPSEEQFLADMGSQLSNSDMAELKQLGEESHAFKVYRAQRWRKALEDAKKLDQPIVRASKLGELWGKDKGLALGGRAMQGIRMADSAVRGAGDALSLGAAGAIDRAIRPEGAEAAEENARANPISNVLGETAGYLSPVGGANAIFSGVKSGVERALPTLGKGAVGALATGAISAPAIGAVERGFDPNQKAFDPDRMAIESLLGAGLGFGGHLLGAAPAKVTSMIENGPRGQTLEAAERLGVRLGPTGGVNLPPAAEALQAERRAIPLRDRPSSETEMVLGRARPRIAEGALAETDALRAGQELQTGAYNASREGAEAVPVERTLQAARDRLGALVDESGRPLPGSKAGMSLAEDLEAQLESLSGDGARKMTAAELDRFLGWVDEQANVAKRAGAKDPLYEDFMRAAREDRQQFGSNTVTDEALSSQKSTTATLGGGEQVEGLGALKAQQELQIAEQNAKLTAAGLPRDIDKLGRYPGFGGEPGAVRLDPQRDIPVFNKALKNVYSPGADPVMLPDGRALKPQDAVEHFARKWEAMDPANAGLVDELRAMGATQLGEELRNMGRLFGQTTQSGARYGRIVHASLPWVRALAGEGRIPPKVLDFVRGLRSGVTGGRYPMPIPGPDDFAANPFGIAPMQGLGLRGGAPAARGRQLVDPAGRSLLSQDDPNEADKTLTEEDVVNLAKLIESTRREQNE